MKQETLSKGEIVIYTSADGKISLDAKLENETIWLTQEQMSVLLGVKRPAITKHISNIYKENELEEQSTCSILEHMGNDDKQKYSTKYYNLDIIIAVGYRVTSKIATHFRRWATNILKDYLVKGYAINQKVSLYNKNIENLSFLAIIICLKSSSILSIIRCISANSCSYFFLRS